LTQPRDLGEKNWGWQELYQSLADAARGSDLEKLLSISDAHLKELNSINAVSCSGTAE
jgi:hypothetical protein